MADFHLFFCYILFFPKLLSWRKNYAFKFYKGINIIYCTFAAHIVNHVNISYAYISVNQHSCPFSWCFSLLFRGLLINLLIAKIQKVFLSKQSIFVIRMLLNFLFFKTDPRWGDIPCFCFLPSTRGLGSLEVKKKQIKLEVSLRFAGKSFTRAFLSSREARWGSFSYYVRGLRKRIISRGRRKTPLPPRDFWTAPTLLLSHSR